VHFAFRHKDYQPAAQDLLADATQVVRATLTPEPRAASPVPPARGRAKRPKPKDDGEIPLEF
jgi:hypothetical protein